MVPLSGLEEMLREMKHEFNRPLTRRDFFKRNLIAGANLVGMLGLMSISSEYRQDTPQTSEPAEKYNPTQRKPSQQNPVKKFAAKIYDVANELTPDFLNVLQAKVDDGKLKYDGSYMGTLLGVSMVAMIFKRPDPLFVTGFYGAAGVTMLTGRMLDNYSTLKFAKTFEDPRFEEYGFNRFILEGNSNLPAYPKPSDTLSLRNLTNETLAVLFGTANIPWGLELGWQGVNVFFNNMKIDYALRLAMQIGDEVKDRISKGHTDDQIRHYLTVARQSGIEKAKSFKPAQSALYR